MAKKILNKEDPVKRSFGLMDLRAVDEGNSIEGHPAVYGQRTNIGGFFDEIIERGAFDQTDFRDVLFSVNHDLQKIPLARSRNNNGQSTMTLTVDDAGLHILANLDVDNNLEAKALHSAVKRSDINGMSFIFYVAEETWENEDTDMPTRRIQKIGKVIEVSAVNFPAYEGTDINARDQSVLDNAAKTLDNVRSQLDSSKSEHDKQLELYKLKNRVLMKG